MTAPTLTSRIPRESAKRRLAASSVAPVASGYELSLCPCATRLSRWQNAVCSDGDR
jgi:hypothetical protein